MTALNAPNLGPHAAPPRHGKIPEAFLPKSIVCLREGYGREFFFSDLGAGVTVAIIALPLSLALAIGSGVRPEQGLFTAIIAGFIISLLGGSRVQIGGPAGAFMAIVAGIVARQGYDGLCIATLMAGVILILMGLAKLGSLIKFIPYPVTTGFTSGIAVIIFTSQIRDLLGLTINYVNDAGQLVHSPPSSFLACWRVLFQSLHSINISAAGIGLGSLLVLALMRRFVPRIPGAIVVVIISAVHGIGIPPRGGPSNACRHRNPRNAFWRDSQYASQASSAGEAFKLERRVRGMVEGRHAGSRGGDDRLIVLHRITSLRGGRGWNDRWPA